MPPYVGARNVGKRSLLTAILLTLILAIYMLIESSHWKLEAANYDPFQGPEPPQQDAPTGETPHEDVPQPKASHEPQPTTSPQPDNPKCSVTKVSMLYGAHKFEQLEAALDSHRRHGERWGCGFESLDRDLTDRKLYSKHYFLLSMMLRELSRPEEERQKWLL